MKMSPKTPNEYLLKTEHAVRHYYAGLDSCWDYYKEANKYWNISKVDQPMTPENVARLNKYLELSRRYFDLKFSEGVFAGSILQIAAMGIRCFSHNKSIPESCRQIVAKDRKAIQICISRELHGLPIGLIIYAARNQYNHWDAERLNKVNTIIFEILSNSFSDNPLSDLRFELSNPSITVYANEVLIIALGWTTYEKYLSEMKVLLSA